MTATNARLFAVQDGGVPGGVNVDVELRDAGVNAFLVVPLQPLAPGQEYRLHVDTFCNGSNSPEAVVAFETQAAAALPTSFGAVVASAPPQLGELDVLTDNGSCTATASCSFVRVAMELEASAQPWKDAFSYQTYVDGQLYQQVSFLTSDPLVGGGANGDGVDRIFAVCSSNSTGAHGGVEPGVHTVEMRGTLLGLEVPLVSTQLTIELGCPPLMRDAGLPLGLDGGATGADAAVLVDGGAARVDGGGSGVDAAVLVDAGSGADAGMPVADAGAPGAKPDAGGLKCACATTSSGPTPLLALMLLWGGVEARRRRLQRGRD